MLNISSVLNLNWKCSQVAIIAAQEGWQKASQWTILPWKPSENSNKSSYLRFTAKIFTNMQYFSLFNITFTQRWNVKAACCGLVFIMYWASNTVLNERPAELWGKVPAPEKKWKWGWWLWKCQVLLVKLPAHTMNISLLRHSSLSPHAAPLETDKDKQKKTNRLCSYIRYIDNYRWRVR